MKPLHLASSLCVLSALLAPERCTAHNSVKHDKLKCTLPGQDYNGLYDIAGAAQDVESAAKCADLCHVTTRCNLAAYVINLKRCFPKTIPFAQPAPTPRAGVDLVLPDRSKLPCGPDVEDPVEPPAPAGCSDELAYICGDICSEPWQTPVCENEECDCEGFECTTGDASTCGSLNCRGGQENVCIDNVCDCACLEDGDDYVCNEDFSSCECKGALKPGAECKEDSNCPAGQACMFDNTLRDYACAAM